MNEERKILENIKQIRKNQKLTKREVANALCMSEANYGRIENGHAALQFRHLAKIASLFGMGVIDVLSYPDKYVQETSPKAEPVEAVLQIKLKKDKKDQVLRLVFGNNNLEILNK